MKIEDNLVAQSIHNVPNGGVIIFDVEGESHLGFKAVNPPRGPYIVTLSHPDYKGTPGLWAYGVATSDAFLHIKDTVIRPAVKNNTSLIYNRSPKPGNLVKTTDGIYLTVRTDRNRFGYVDLKDGNLHESLPSTVAFQIASWKILIERKLSDELLFEFPIAVDTTT